MYSHTDWLDIFLPKSYVFISYFPCSSYFFCLQRPANSQCTSASQVLSIFKSISNYIHVSTCLLYLIDHPSFQKILQLPFIYSISYKGKCITLLLLAANTDTHSHKHTIPKAAYETGSGLLRILPPQTLRALSVLKWKHPRRPGLDFLSTSSQLSPRSITFTKRE